ncbi:MAG: hypothetical protein HOP31_01660, partial [Ignavibacteria bacterium]|nr:hypothetical protein [Ignavibacteria bacterium]
MPKILLTIALIFGINSVLFSQSGWIWQNPLPQGNNMSNLQFVNSTTAYAMCFNSVMKSTNTGSNWSIYYTNHSQNNTSLQFINETTGFIVSDSGIVLKTVNGGVDWNNVYDFHEAKFHKIYFSDVNTGYLLRYNNYYSGFGTLLYRTTNSGISWNVILNDTTVTLNDVKFTSVQNGYFAGYFGNYSHNFRYAKILKTTNGGLSIDSVNTGFFGLVTGLDIKNNIVFVYGGTGLPYVSGILYSTNDGISWIPSDLHKTVKDFSYVDSGNLFASVSTGGSGLPFYKSTNNGANWSNIGSDIKSYEIEFINPTTGISVGSNGQVHRTTNSGVNWIRTTTTIFDSYFWSVEFVNSTTGFAGGSNSLLKTTNGGNNWVLIPRIPGDQIEFTDVNTGYAANVDTMYKTTNCGLNWINLNYGLPGQINEIHFINNNTGFYIGKYNILKKTTDGGNSWTQITGYGGYYQECMFFYNESLGFIGREDYNLGWGISRTTNGGLNWDFQQVPEYDNYIWDIFFINEYTGFYTTSNRIFKTTNSGNSWYIICEGLTFYDIMSIQFLDEDIGYASASGGKVLKTADGGSTWKIHNSISNYLFYDMYFTDINTGYFVSFDGVIVKTTNGCGDPIGIEPISSKIPESFELYQNYPNPFNPVTTIRFSIPNNIIGRNELTSLKIFDILGKEIAMPVSEILTP